MSAQLGRAERGGFAPLWSSIARPTENLSAVSGKGTEKLVRGVLNAGTVVVKDRRDSDCCGIVE